MTEDEKANEAESHTVGSPEWIGRFVEMQVSPFLAKWRERIKTHPDTGLPLAPIRPRLAGDALSIEHLAFSAGRGLRVALALFAPMCGLLFLASFFIPYPVVEQVVRSCSIAGLIGFGTNWVAIKMLFRPRTVRPILGQGLIPSQRDEIIRKVADEVIEKLINERIIRQELEDSRLISRLTRETVEEVKRLVRDPEFVDDAKRLILTYAARLAENESFREEVISEVETRVKSFAGPSLAQEVVGKMRGLWRGSVVKIVNRELDSLPETLDRLVGELDEALDHVPRYFEEHQEAIDSALTRIVMSLIREMDVRHVILKQLSTVTSEQLEEGFREFADDKLSYITLLGGVLGLVGGFVIIWPLWSIAVLAGLLAFLGILDVVAYAILRRRSVSPRDN